MPTKRKKDRKALFLHVPGDLLDRLDSYVSRYSEEIGVPVSRADIVRMILEAHLEKIKSVVAESA